MCERFWTLPYPTQTGFKLNTPTVAISKRFGCRRQTGILVLPFEQSVRDESRRGRVEPSPCWGALARRRRRPTGIPYSSRLAERHGDKPGGIAGLHPHQNVMLALRLCFSQRGAHVVCIADCLAAHIEDDVAGLEALIRSGPIGIDPGGELRSDAEEK